MDWSNESYVRLYSRDTKTWLKLGWEGQALLALVLRKLDRAGVMDDVRDAGDLAVMLANGMPLGIVEQGLKRLLENEVLAITETGLLMPNFIEAQEAKKSDPQRQRESRERKRSQSRNVTVESRNVTVASENRSLESQPVTACHNLSQPVTLTSADPLLCSALLASAVPPYPPGGEAAAAATEPTSRESNPKPPTAPTQLAPGHAIGTPPAASGAPGPIPPSERQLGALATKTKKPSKPRQVSGPPPDDFVPDAATLAVASETGRDWRTDWTACRDWHLAKGQKVFKVDYQATLRGWMRRGLDQPCASGSSRVKSAPHGSPDAGYGPQPNDPNNRYKPRMFGDPEPDQPDPWCLTGTK